MAVLTERGVSCSSLVVPGSCGCCPVVLTLLFGFCLVFHNYMDIFFLFNEKGKSFAIISIKKQRCLDSDSRPRPEASPSQALQLGLSKVFS
jgi:hypothetical protein